MHFQKGYQVYYSKGFYPPPATCTVIVLTRLYRGNGFELPQFPRGATKSKK